jgi:heme exporter protein A
MSEQSTRHPLIIASGLTKKFGAVTAVRNVDLTIYGGDCLAVFGPNGAGKTTLLRLIGGLLQPTAGRLCYAEGVADCSDPTCNQTHGLAGQQVHDSQSASSQTSEPIQRRRQVGYVSHQTLLYNDLTGRENLEFYARLYGLSAPRERAGAQLAKLGLRDAADSLVRGYSRGMKQRLTLARALLHEPRLLLLDEPYTGLDQHGGRLLSQLLQSVREEGRTVLLITHNLAEGLSLCNRALIQHRGRVVFEADRRTLDPGGFEQTYFQLVAQ